MEGNSKMIIGVVVLLAVVGVVILVIVSQKKSTTPAVTKASDSKTTTPAATTPATTPTTTTPAATTTATTPTTTTPAATTTATTPTTTTAATTTATTPTTTTPAATTPSTTAAPVAVQPYPYGGNNGTVTGQQYCQGAWGSSDGKAKKMVCTGGINAVTSASVGCNDSLGTGNFSFACEVPGYAGDNGTVTGQQYCLGAWGQSNGSNKNMVCLNGIDNSNGNSVTCTQALQSGGNYSFSCKAPNYAGNNGSVNGNTYCTGVWGQATGADKNLKCAGGINNGNNTAVDCTSGLGAGNFQFFCT